VGDLRAKIPCLLWDFCRIPYSLEQGILKREQGIILLEQGISFEQQGKPTPAKKPAAQTCQFMGAQKGISTALVIKADYQRTRTHLALDQDCPDPRPIMPRRIGKVVAIPKVGGLHHRYERLAA
jgi:hypothetical protein